MKKSLLSLIAISILISCKESKKTDIKEEVTASVSTKEIDYHADSVTMKGFMAYPADTNGKKPAVLVVHEWWGHNEHARQKAKMLAKLGYVALAVDMYGDGKQANHPQDAGGFAMSVMGNFVGAKARFEKAIETLKNDPRVNPEKIAAIGYCFGGSVVLAMANSGMDLDGVAAFHAGLQLPNMAKKDSVVAKVLVMNGEDDPFIPADVVSAYKLQLDSAHVSYSYISLPGTVHGYTNPDADSIGKKFELPLKYNKDSDEKANAELEKFLAEIFK